MERRQPPEFPSRGDDPHEPGKAAVKRRSRGFTLMETLLAITLFTIVIASSYSIFSMGIQIWKRSRGSFQSERKALLALEKMGAEIRTTLKTKKEGDFKLGASQPEFGGSETALRLPAIVAVYDRKGKPFTQYGRVTYEWKSGKGELCRAAEGATDFYLDKTPPCKILSRDIKRFKFQYWLYDKLGGSYSWYDSWELKDGLPQAVGISLTVGAKTKTEGAAPDKEFRRIFLLPVGGKPEMSQGGAAAP